MVFVSDRGMVTTANLAALRDKQIDWITALKAPQVKALNAAGALALSLFDDRNLAEIDHADYPGERLIVCRNPLLAAERARKREALLKATEAKLQPIRERVERGTLRGEAKIGLAVGAIRDKYKMSKHIELEIGDEKLPFRAKKRKLPRKPRSTASTFCARPLMLNSAPAMSFARIKELAKVERAFRTMKSDDLEIRPIHHRLEDRVRAHVFLCMLAYYLEWHLRKAWAPLLFADENPQVPEDPVTQAMRSPQAVRKARSRQTQFGDPAHSFRTLIDHLARQMRATMIIAGSGSCYRCYRIAEPTPTQAHALKYAETVPAP